MLKQAKSFISPSTAQVELMEMLKAANIQFDAHPSHNFIDARIGSLAIEFDRDGRISGVTGDAAEESDAA